MLTWDEPNERYYQHGVDRGVLYTNGSDGAVVWNGLTGVDESGEGESHILYRDGLIYMADVVPGDFKGKATALFYPDEFSTNLGIVEAAGGLYVDYQKPKRFGMSYRSLIGSGTAGDMFGYQIHLVYNAMAAIGDRDHRTTTDSPNPMDFAFDLVCTPVKLPGYRPSAHYILDTRHLDVTLIKDLEDILYGTDGVPGRLPTPLELFEWMNFGVTITVTDIQGGVIHGNVGGNLTVDLFTIAGNKENVVSKPDGSFQANNINATDNADGTYTITDGGDTVVIGP